MGPANQPRVTIEFDVPVPMRDGTVLRANVYRPEDASGDSYPIILTRTPYGKDLPLGGSTLLPAQAARRGYIVVVQDVRGTFTSDGMWFPLLNEADDGEDTIEWAAGLPGSNGTVGMYGGSYVGFTQWATAKRRSTALRAMVPMITWDDPHNGVTTRNGVLELGLQGYWSLMTGLNQVMRRYMGTPERLGPALYSLVHDFDALPVSGYSELPLMGFGPLSRQELEEPLDYFIRTHGDMEASEPARITSAYAHVDIPMLHIGGWYDVFLKGTLNNFTAMQSMSQSRQQLLIGPWAHGVFTSAQGDIDFGLSSSGTLLDLQADMMTYQLLFLDRWLRGVPNGTDLAPAVKYYTMGTNVWQTADTWPPAGTRAENWYLHSAGHANTSTGDGVLTTRTPEDERSDTYVYDPAHPVPTIGGATLMHPVLRPGPRDQHPVEQRDDVLVYTSAALAEPLEVTGPVSVVLYVATDVPDTDFVARLVDVYPDGTAINITDGVTRMRWRDGMASLAPTLKPDEVYRVEIDLWSTSLVFLPGHRIRLDVTSSSFPRWDRNLNTGDNNWTTTDMRVARQRVLHDVSHPSHVVLSVLSRQER
jgi:putative CocE/NonD family hydrolase